ncbi:head-tail joining protein [Roseomonas chloroacetimidivorans]|uniref:head-tail joining protein n=1 Tax=Roseomonas chloroacetimidivorans TaxID=1766656 RepID=UPI003C77311B
MDVFAQAMADLAASDLGEDAEYRILGNGPPVPVRVVFEYDDVSLGRVGRPIAALIPQDAVQIGQAQRGDTLTAKVDGALDVLKVEQALPGWSGWAWRLSFSRGR